MSEADLNRVSRRRHAAKAQFYRWFQLYERLHTRPWATDLVERQLQIFADRFRDRRGRRARDHHA
ncbi:hypothetical protein [Streptomyces sp. KS 21]|uniref:hypothetical protein n=1 Tax=Streptomyces sp. KS 21 TaxID=2485150 RepID=UPI001063EFD0|nr:hypothetical protein [Streptomyces sp. KS 21]TDU73528.1 hypothetical protein EDD91_0077 [Streptomyces sp. KS 21]